MLVALRLVIFEALILLILSIMVVLFLHFLFNKHNILIFTLNNIWCIIITIEKQKVKKRKIGKNDSNN